MRVKVSARLRSCPGKPGDVICRIAVEESASFIVIGTRGSSSALKRTVLGTVSDHIIRHAPCPVLVCRDMEVVKKQRRRHMSAGAGESDADNARRQSETGRERVRHKSGDTLTTFASNLRRRLSSGGSSSRVSSPFDSSGPDNVFETSTVLYPGSGLHDLQQQEMKTCTNTVPEKIHQATIEQ